jgi:hypothetical protein
LIANIDRVSFSVVKVALVSLVCVVGCGFHSSSANGPDGGFVPDAFVIDGGAPDVPGSTARVRTGLIALWELDQHDATTVNDTSGFSTPVPLSVTNGTVTFADSTMTLSGGALIASTGRPPRLNADVAGACAVTLEAWVSATVADQGSAAAPVVIAGLCSSVASRNISLMQAGTRWLARVRTNADNNGKPDLMSTVDIVPGAMTHLVVVADARQRTLYVDGVPVANDPAPSAPQRWDASYKMALGNELSLNRPWSGTFALVAMYKQALSTGQVTTNRLAGPNGL